MYLKHQFETGSDKNRFGDLGTPRPKKNQVGQRLIVLRAVEIREQPIRFNPAPICLVTVLVTYNVGCGPQIHVSAHSPSGRVSWALLEIHLNTFICSFESELINWSVSPDAGRST